MSIYHSPPRGTQAEHKSIPKPKSNKTCFDLIILGFTVNQYLLKGYLLFGHRASRLYFSYPNLLACLSYQRYECLFVFWAVSFQQLIRLPGAIIRKYSGPHRLPCRMCPYSWVKISCEISILVPLIVFPNVSPHWSVEFGLLWLASTAPAANCTLPEPLINIRKSSCYTGGFEWKYWTYRLRL